MIKRDKLIISILIVLALIASGYFVWKKLGHDIESPLIEQQETSTTNWKTYENEEYGFEFKYPNDWIIEEGTSYGSTLPDIEVKSPKLDFDKIYAFGAGVFIQDVSSNNEYKENILKNSNYTISNIPALSQFALNNPKHYARNTAVVKENLAFIIGLSFAGDSNEFNKSKSVLDQILSTFKFTNSEIIGDGKVLKNYVNDKYSFEIKYPPQWKFSTNSSNNADGFFFVNGDSNLSILPRGEFDHGLGGTTTRIDKIISNKTVAEVIWTNSKMKFYQFIDTTLPKNWISCSNSLVNCNRIVLNPTNDSDANIMQQMIATFKFTK